MKVKRFVVSSVLAAVAFGGMAAPVASAAPAAPAAAQGGHNAQCASIANRMSWNIHRHRTHVKAGARDGSRAIAHKRAANRYASWARYDARKYRAGKCGGINIEYALTHDEYPISFARRARISRR